jgi:hypothetical protein
MPVRNDCAVCGKEALTLPAVVTMRVSFSSNDVIHNTANASDVRRFTTIDDVLLAVGDEWYCENNAAIIAENRA